MAAQRALVCKRAYFTAARAQCTAMRASRKSKITRVFAAWRDRFLDARASMFAQRYFMARVGGACIRRWHLRAHRRSNIQRQITDLQTRVMARVRCGAALETWRKAWLRNVQIRHACGSDGEVAILSHQTIAQCARHDSFSTLIQPEFYGRVPVMLLPCLEGNVDNIV